MPKEIINDVQKQMDISRKIMDIFKEQYSPSRSMKLMKVLNPKLFLITQPPLPIPPFYKTPLTSKKDV